mgnify:CR=1 FL=1
MRTKKTRVVSCEISPLRTKELVVYKANNGRIFSSKKDAREENVWDVPLIETAGRTFS